MPLDDTISAGQAGHIADHQTIAAFVNGLSRRGGNYTATRATVTASTVHAMTLSTTVSGDSDMLSSGDLVIPAGAAGAWALSATWQHGDAMPASTRNFIDMDVRVGGVSNRIYRQAIPPSEDRVTVSTATVLAVGDVVRISIFRATGITIGQIVTLDAYRIGV